MAVLKPVHVVDELTREALAIRRERRTEADITVAVLDRPVAAPRPLTEAHPQCNTRELNATRAPLYAPRAALARGRACSR
jgi:hypothetical protein